MVALARFAERCLVILRAKDARQSGLKRAVTVLAALGVIAVALAVSYLRMAYQWGR